MSYLVWIQRWHPSMGEKVNFLCHSWGFIYTYGSKRASLLTNLPVCELKHIHSWFFISQVKEALIILQNNLSLWFFTCSCKASTVLYFFFSFQKVRKVHASYISSHHWWYYGKYLRSFNWRLPQVSDLQISREASLVSTYIP